MSGAFWVVAPKPHRVARAAPAPREDPRGEGHAAAAMPATDPSWVVTHAVVRHP
jgi:hypothetical protein